MNKKMWLYTAVLVVIVISSCIVLVALYLPGYAEKKEIISATKTQAAYVQQTQNVLETATSAESTKIVSTQFAETLTAMPTATFTPTITLTPTIPPTIAPTTTPTPIPVAQECTAKITGTDRIMFKMPSAGVPTNTKLPVGQEIVLTGKMEDSGWYKIQFNQTEGWVRSDFFTIVGDCVPTTYQIHYLLNIPTIANEILVDDTFVSNKSQWKLSTGSFMYPEQTNYGDEQLILDNPSSQIISMFPDKPELGNIKNFHLITSFTRTSYDLDNSWVGVQFRSNNGNAYAIRISPLCELSVLSNDAIVFRRDLRKECVQNQYVLDLELSNYDLLVSLNNSDQINISLPDPSGLYSSGSISLSAVNSKSVFDFYLLTSPK